MGSVLEKDWQTAVWVTTAVGFVTAYLMRFGLAEGGVFVDVDLLGPIALWIGENSGFADMIGGIVVPFLILMVLELLEKHESPGWDRAVAMRQAFEEKPVAKAYAPGQDGGYCFGCNWSPHDGIDYNRQ